MFKAVLVFRCANCGGDFPTETNHKLEDTPFFPITLDFKSGVFSFPCPECNHFNEIKLNNGEDDQPKGKRLPRMRRM